MVCIAYQKQNFRNGALKVIEQANTIIAEYKAEGYVMTLRQLYYQFVSRDYIANKLTEYKRLAVIISDARLAGLIDWNAIEDRTRNLDRPSAWDAPSDIIASAAHSFRLNPWLDQPHYIEVWVEKEALGSVIARACNPFRVPFFSCKGYVSQSEMHDAAMRFRNRAMNGKETFIIHLGDHDPSGIDMTRDIEDRFALFLGASGHEDSFKVERIALNFDQIKKFNPPPNPAKMTDSRFEGYARNFGTKSWELDALDPKKLNTLITTQIKKHILDPQAWDDVMGKEQEDRDALQLASQEWDRVETFLQDIRDGEV